MKVRVALWTLFSFLLTSGFATAGPWIDRYWPLNEGDTKTFLYSGVNQLTIDVFYDYYDDEYEISYDSPDGSGSEFHQNTGTGIYLDHAKVGWINVYLDPPVLLLNDNMLQNGGSATTSTTVSQQGVDYPATYKITISKTGSVKVPAGTFADCRNISLTETATVPGQGTITVNAMTAVLAPDVGIIKKLVSQGVWAELVSGTVDGTDVAILATGPPVLTIKTPVKGQRIAINSNSVAVTGSVSGYSPGMEVFYQINSDAWASALVAGTNWSGSVLAQAGTNVLNAYALDSVGRSSPTVGVGFQFIVTSPVTIETEGVGTLTPNYNGQLLELGRNYSLTATPGTGYAFTNWTGHVDGNVVLTTNKAALSFVMQSNLALTVTFVDVVKPVLTITAPTPNQRWSNAVFTVAGKVTDNGPGGTVWYQLNGGDWTAGSGWSNWTASVMLNPGTNTVSAYAMDMTGNRSVTNSQKVVYVLTAPFGLTVVGKGTVSGASNGQWLEIGKAVTLTTAPASGYVLTNWQVTVDEVSVLSTNRAVPFMMQSNLVLTVTFVDVAKPVLTITAPTPNQRWSNAVFTVAGKVTDNGPGGTVWYQLNGGDWTAGSGWSNWTASVMLNPGTNTVSAYAMDMAGNRSVTNSQKVVYVLTAPFGLAVVGKGTVSGASNGQWLEIGKAVTLTTAPASGYVLTNWQVTVDEVSVLSTNRAVPFMMQSNLVLTATFVDVAKPVLTITAPTSGQRWSNAVFTVAGKVTDNGPGGTVWYQLNGGDWTAGSGWSNWTASVMLNPGTNTVSAYAADTAGNHSVTNSQKVVYVLTAPFGLTVVGKGTVSGASNGQWLEIGKAVTLTTAPASGYVLTNWQVQVDSVTVLTTNRAVPFMMQSNLVLTATFVDVAKPVLTITAPTPNQRWSNAVFTVAGKVTDNGPSGTVWYQLNGGDWNAASGWSNWTASVMLNPGTNTVSAYAADTAGNHSVTNSQKVVYVLTAPFGLAVVGKGTVSGASNGQWLEIGKAVTLTTAPAAGYVLTNWQVQVDSVTVLTTNKAVPFMMQSNLVLTATFVDVAKPGLTITAPTPNQRWSNAVFTVAGKVTDNGPGGTVWYQLNGGDWTAGSGWSNWTASVTLNPGTNTVSAYAMDMAGNRSVTNSQKVVYVKMYTLVDYYPLPLGAHWLYDGTDEDGYPTKFSDDVTDTNFVITIYAGRNPVIGHPTNCVRVSAAYLDWTTQDPYDTWDEYMAIGGRFGSFGDDDLPDESMRVAGGIIAPAQMAVGSSATLNADAYMFGAYAGTASITFQLIEHTSLTVPAGSFPDVLHMRWQMSAPDGTQVHDEWWAKSVGKIKRLHISGNSSAVSYELIQYSLPPGSALSQVSSDVANVPATPDIPLQFESGNEGMSVVNGSLQMRLSGPVGALVVVESSADLVHWTPIQTNTMTAEGIILTMPMDQQPMQFFRARLP